MRNFTYWYASGECERITAAQVAQWTGCSERTARRWMQNPNAVPEPARRLITLCALGGVLPADWRKRGFRFWGDLLHSGNGEKFNAGHLEYASLQWGQINSLSRRVEMLTRDLADHREYIDYLLSLVKVADVIQFDRSRARPSLTDGKQSNSLFHKPPERI